MKILLAGWFSYKMCGATAGDLITRDMVCDWLNNNDIEYDVALAAPFKGGVELMSVNPVNYSHVIFVCGPYFPNNLTKFFLIGFLYADSSA